MAKDPTTDLPATAVVRAITIDNIVHLEVEGLDHARRVVEFPISSVRCDERTGVTAQVWRRGRPLSAMVTLDAGVLQCSVLPRGVGNSPVGVGLRTVQDLQQKGIHTVLRVVKDEPGESEGGF